MTTMVNKLNSGESFKSSSKFTADLTFIRMPKGGKSARQKALLGKRSTAEVLKKKHSVIQITNSDALCCARAICVAKAWIHKDEGYRQKINYGNAKKFETVRSRMAHQLHEDVGIPLGACRHQELKKFQDFLAPDYQLKVMATSYPYMVVFVGPEAPHIIRYVDVTSEYPYVNKYGTYPIGHPEIFLEPDDKDPASYYGILTVDILPPYHLYNPVLPLRQGKKLTFPLC